jgi:hypothetical protein
MEFAIGYMFGSGASAGTIILGLAVLFVVVVIAKAIFGDI